MDKGCRSAIRRFQVNYAWVGLFIIQVRRTGVRVRVRVRVHVQDSNMRRLTCGSLRGVQGSRHGRG